MAITIQQLSIQIRNYLLRQQEASRQGHILSYTAARQVGVLFNAPTPAEAQAVDILVQGLLNDAKSVTAFTYLVNEPSPACKVPFKAFRPQDFDRIGNIKHEFVNRFLDMPLDYLICFGIRPNAVYQHLMMRSGAQCRIGTTETGLDELLDLAFDTQDLIPTDAATAVLGYLRKLQGAWQKPVYLADN